MSAYPTAGEAAPFKSAKGSYEVLARLLARALAAWWLRTAPDDPAPKG